MRQTQLLLFTGRSVALPFGIHEYSWFSETIKVTYYLAQKQIVKIYCLTEGRKLSQPRHCSNDVQKQVKLCMINKMSMMDFTQSDTLSATQCNCWWHRQVHLSRCRSEHSDWLFTGSRSLQLHQFWSPYRQPFVIIGSGFYQSDTKPTVSEHWRLLEALTPWPSTDVVLYWCTAKSPLRDWKLQTLECPNNNNYKNTCHHSALMLVASLQTFQFLVFKRKSNFTTLQLCPWQL